MVFPFWLRKVRVSSSHSLLWWRQEFCYHQGCRAPHGQSPMGCWGPPQKSWRSSPNRQRHRTQNCWCLGTPWRGTCHRPRRTLPHYPWSHFDQKPHPWTTQAPRLSCPPQGQGWLPHQGILGNRRKRASWAQRNKGRPRRQRRAKRTKRDSKPSSKRGAGKQRRQGWREKKRTQQQRMMYEVKNYAHRLINLQIVLWRQN